MSLYVAYRRDQPERAAFIDPVLAEVARAVAAQPNPDDFEVLFNQDGFARALGAEEQAEVDALQDGDDA